MTAGRRAQLASALRQSREFRMTFRDPAAEWIADALLPTIDRMIRQAQAEALESAADMQDFAMRDFDLARHLRDRAAALRVTTDHPDVTQDAP